MIGKTAQAIEDFDQALRLDPGLALAYNSRGSVYYDLGDYGRAIENFDQALRLDPGDDEAYDNRAESRCLLGMIEASLDDRMQAIRLGASTAEAYQLILLVAGFYKGAIDGDFGPAAQQALRDWTVAGCR